MSWERRREEWKNSPPPVEKIDEWFGVLSEEEKSEAFFESKSFEILVEKFKQELMQMQENVKEHGIFLRWPPETKIVSYGLLKVVLQTPSFMEMIHNNENLAKYIANRSSDVARRLFVIFSYPSAIPTEAFNLDQEWEVGKTEVSNTPES